MLGRQAASLAGFHFEKTSINLNITFQTGIFLTETGDIIGKEDTEVYVSTGSEESEDSWQPLFQFCKVDILRYLQSWAVKYHTPDLLRFMQLLAV